MQRKLADKRHGQEIITSSRTQRRHIATNTHRRKTARRGTNDATDYNNKLQPATQWTQQKQCGRTAAYLAKHISTYKHQDTHTNIRYNDKAKYRTKTTEERHNTAVRIAASKLEETRHTKPKHHTKEEGTAAVEPQKNRNMKQHEQKHLLAAQTAKQVRTKAYCCNEHMIISKEQAPYKNMLYNRHITSRSRQTNIPRI